MYEETIKNMHETEADLLEKVHAREKEIGFVVEHFPQMLAASSVEDEAWTWILEEGREYGSECLADVAAIVVGHRHRKALNRVADAERRRGKGESTGEVSSSA